MDCFQAVVPSEGKNDANSRGELEVTSEALRSTLTEVSQKKIFHVDFQKEAVCNFLREQKRFGQVFARNFHTNHRSESLSHSREEGGIEIPLKKDPLFLGG